MSVTEDPRRERDAAETPQRRDPRRTTAQGQKPREQRRESAQPKAAPVASETRGPRVSRDPRRDSTRPRLDVAAAEQPPPQRTHVRFAEEPRRSPLPSRQSGKPANDVPRTSDKPRRSLTPARAARAVDEASSRPTGMQDALRERLAARAARASDDPPVDGRRSPSQPGQSPSPARAAAGGKPVYCEIDGLAVEIDPAELSTVGLFIESPSPPPLDTEVRVFLSIGALQIEAAGHVVKSVSQDAAKRERRRPGYGLLFSRLDERTRAAFRDALESKPPLAAPEAAPRESVKPRRSSPAEAKQPDPKELEILARLKSELASLEQQPAWTILGISQSADTEAARQAFFTASKRYHPHVYARYSHPEIKAVVTQLFIACKRAFTTMTKTGRGTRGVAAARAARSGDSPGRSSDPGNR